MFLNKIEKEHLCWEYIFDQAFIEGQDTLVSLTIVLMNLVVKQVGSILIDWIGFHTKEEHMMNFMTLIFVFQYINTALLLVVVNARIFPDYSSEWYLVVGQDIQKTMFIQSFMPYMLFAFFFSIKACFRFYDSKTLFFSHITYTKKKTKGAYISLYCGPEVNIHARYAFVMRDIFTAFTHGVAIPSLMPIALFSVFNVYVTERLCFAYWYKQPPLFDNEFNIRVVRILKKAPYCLLLNAYWLLGNRQMFFNEFSKISNEREYVDSKRAVFDFSKGISGSTFILAFIPIFFLVTVTVNPFLRFISKTRFESINNKARLSIRESPTKSAVDDITISRAFEDHQSCVFDLKSNKIYSFTDVVDYDFSLKTSLQELPSYF